MTKRSKKKRVRAEPTLAPPPLIASRDRSLWISLLLAIAALTVYLPSLSSDFVYDAHKEIVEEGFITSISNLPDVLSLKVLGMNLMLADRPGQLLYLMLIAVFSGKEPFGYHLCSDLLHAVNVALLFVLLIRLIASEIRGFDRGKPWMLLLTSTAAALIFALHPLSVESVAEVSYSSSLLVAFFTLAALLSATFFDPQSKRTALLVGSLGTLCALGAVTAKESGISGDTVTIFWKTLLAPLLANLSLSQEIQLKMSSGK